jgi:hypothetical protein
MDGLGKQRLANDTLLMGPKLFHRRRNGDGRPILPLPLPFSASKISSSRFGPFQCCPLFSFLPPFFTCCPICIPMIKSSSSSPYSLKRWMVHPLPSSSLSFSSPTHKAPTGGQQKRAELVAELGSKMLARHIKTDILGGGNGEGEEGRRGGG